MSAMLTSATKPRRWYGWPPNCASCGRFTNPVDWVTPWGGAADLEPPEDEALCASCAQRSFDVTLDSVLTRGLFPAAMRPSWVSPDYWYRARSAARGVWRHGLAVRPVVHVRARHESLPDPYRIREWCTCGWSTGWQEYGRVGSPHLADWLCAGTLLRGHIDSGDAA